MTDDRVIMGVLSDILQLLVSRHVAVQEGEAVLIPTDAARSASIAAFRTRLASDCAIRSSRSRRESPHSTSPRLCHPRLSLAQSADAALAAADGADREG
jgi:hypothetical protein